MMGARWHIDRGLGTAALVAAVVLVASIVPAQAAGTRSPVWAARYAPPDTTYNTAVDLAVSAGGRLFVAGQSDDAFLTVAYDQTSGTRLWARRTVTGSVSGVRAVAASPSGSMVYVTGYSESGVTDEDFLTIAYDAATGTKVWSARFNQVKAGENTEDLPQAIEVSPDGSRVFVAGWTAGTYAVLVAYDARTGARLWARSLRYATGFLAMAVAPDGSRVYATGEVTPDDGYADYFTVAFKATSGATVWSKQYDGPAGGTDQAYLVAASPDGTRVFVSGVVDSVVEPGITTVNLDWGTVAYKAATGGRSWAKVYAGSAQAADIPSAVAVAPGSNRVYVLGATDTVPGTGQTATAMIAYAAGTGTPRWLLHPALPYRYLALSPDGTRLYVAGGAGDAAAFSASGTLVWTATEATAHETTDVGVSSDGALVFVVGTTQAPSYEEAFLTVAYGR